MTTTLKNFTEEKEIIMTHNVKASLEKIAKDTVHRRQENKLQSGEDKVTFLAYVHDYFLNNNKDARQQTTAKLMLESPEIQNQLLAIAALERNRGSILQKEVAANAGIDAADASQAMRRGQIALFDMTHHRTDHLDSLQMSVKAYAAHYGIKNPGDAMMLNAGSKYDKAFLTELRTLMDPYLTDKATKVYLAKAAIEANKEQTMSSGLEKLMGVFNKDKGVPVLDNRAVAEIENTKNRFFEKGVRSINMDDLKSIALKGASLQQDQLERKSQQAAQQVGVLTKISNTIGNFLVKTALNLPSHEYITTANIAQKAVQMARGNTAQQQLAY